MGWAAVEEKPAAQEKTEKGVEVHQNPQPAPRKRLRLLGIWDLPGGLIRPHVAPSPHAKPPRAVPTPLGNTPAFNPRIGSLVTLTGDLGMTGAGGEHGKVGKLIKKNNATKKAVVRLHYNGSDRVVPLSNLTKATAGDKKAPMNKKSNRFDPYRTPYSYSYDTERMNKA